MQQSKKFFNQLIAILIFIVCNVAFVFANIPVNEFVRIENRWYPNERINIEKGPLVSAPVKDGAWSAMWTISKVPGTKYYRITNRWKTNHRIHMENGKLEVSPIKDGAWSAMWIIKPVPGTNYVRIENRWKTGHRIHREKGKITCTPIKDGAWSAMWSLAPVNQNFSTNDFNKRNLLGAQKVTSSAPPAFDLPAGTRVYEGIKSKKEIDINGLGRCYDIRNIDPLQWTKETLKNQRSAKVFDFFRDNQTRQFDFNQKQYAVPMGISVVHDSRGKGEVSYKHVITANEFESSVLQEYRLGVGVPKVASAKASIGFKDTNGGSSKNSNLFTFTKQLATYYKTDIQTDHPTYTHKLDDIFYDGVRQLGHTMSVNEFIQKFGTHFASTTAYGGNFLQRTTISQEEYAHYSKSEREFKLDVEATIKKINISAGTTQGSSSSNSNSQSVTTSNMELLTVGGDPNIQNPTAWSKTVKKNPTVVEVQLTSLAELLTAKYFSNIPNIAVKQKLLATAINEKVKEAKNQMSRKETHSFYTKKPMEFTFTVTAIECVNEGDVHSDGDFFGELSMGFFGKNGSNLSAQRFMYLSNDDHDFQMYKGQRLSVKKATGRSGKMSKKIMPGRDMKDGYVQIWGWMKEDDDPDDDMGSYLKGQKNHKAISYQEAMVIGRGVNRSLDYKAGKDHVRIHYQLMRTK